MDLLGCIPPEGLSHLNTLICLAHLHWDRTCFCLPVLIAKSFISCSPVNEAVGSAEGKVQLSLTWV